jgi:hypothetical protein
MRKEIKKKWAAATRKATHKTTPDSNHKSAVQETSNQICQVGYGNNVIFVKI